MQIKEKVIELKQSIHYTRYKMRWWFQVFKPFIKRFVKALEIRQAQEYKTLLDYYYNILFEAKNRVNDKLYTKAEGN